MSAYVHGAHVIRLQDIDDPDDDPEDDFDDFEDDEDENEDDEDDDGDEETWQVSDRHLPLKIRLGLTSGNVLLDWARFPSSATAGDNSAGYVPTA